MNVPEMLFAGQNVCKQVGEDQNDIILEFTKIDIKTLCNLEKTELQFFDVIVTSYHGLFAVDETIYIFSTLLDNGLKILKFSHLIKKITSVDSYCLILLETGDLHKYDFTTHSLRKLEFANVENNGQADILEDVEAGFAFSSCYTKSNTLFNIPTKLHTFKSHEKIKKIKLGAEHGILLTMNGDCFTWGCGLRGQLGHGEIGIENQPKIVELLAGIKVVDVTASGFHSHAVSAFGDIYSFGWNSNGQLGLPTVQNMSLKTFKTHHQTVFSVPQIIEMDPEVTFTNISSGFQHIVAKTEEGRYFTCGSNKYGQLGIPCNDSFKFNKIKEDSYVDKLTEIENENLNVNSKIITGDWCTIILNYK